VRTTACPNLYLSAIWFCRQVSTLVCREVTGSQPYRKYWYKEEGETRGWFVSSCICWAATVPQNLREFGASCVLDHLLLALALLPLVVVLTYASSSATPASRHNDERRAGCRGGDVVRLLVDKLVEPELELLVLTVIRPLCRHDIRFLFCFNNDSLMLTRIVARIGARWTRRGARGGCEADDVEHSFLWRVTASGLGSDCLRVLLRLPRIFHGNEVVPPAGWHAVKRVGSTRAVCLGIEISERECENSCA
jgi:hypothetical protein